MKYYNQALYDLGKYGDAQFQIIARVQVKQRNLLRRKKNFEEAEWLILGVYKHFPSYNSSEGDEEEVDEVATELHGSLDWWEFADRM